MPCGNDDFAPRPYFANTEDYQHVEVKRGHVDLSPTRECQFDTRPTTTIEAVNNRIRAINERLDALIAKLDRHQAERELQSATESASPTFDATPEPPSPPPCEPLDNRLAAAYAVPDFQTIANIEVPNGVVRWYEPKPVKALRLIRDYNLNGNLFAKGDYLVAFKDVQDNDIWAHMNAAYFEKEYKFLCDAATTAGGA